MNGAILVKEGGKEYSVKKRPCGCEAWMFEGNFHREEGPARIYCEEFIFEGKWFYKGQLHREDGPAVIYRNNKYGSMYFLNGSQYSKNNFLDKLKDKIIMIKGQLHLIDGRPLREK